MISIDTKTILKTPENETFTVNNVPQTVGKYIAHALGMTVVKGEDNIHAWALSKRFAQDDIVKVSDEELIMIKRYLQNSEIFPFITGQIMEILLKLQAEDDAQEAKMEEAAAK